MPYDEAAKTLSANERTIVARTLKAWRDNAAATAQLARNFVHEQQLDLPTHRAFLQQLALRWAPSPELALFTLAAYKSECVNFHLQGPFVSGVQVELAGRAAVYRSFKVYLERTFARAGIAISLAALESELRALAAACAAGPALAGMRTAAFFRGLPIAGNPTWCAFVHPDRATNPFVPPRTTVEQICETYGLGMIDPPEELALFTYVPNAALRCPTVADAGDYHYFRPPPASVEHGWTEPLRRFNPNGTSQPEAVHQSLMGDAPNLSFRTVW